MDEPEVVQYLLNTEVIPHCLRIMETGTDMSKTVATFIVQKILLDDVGLNYVCEKLERFVHVSAALHQMLRGLNPDTNFRLLKQIVKCYHRLSENPLACETLRKCLPPELSDQSLVSTLRQQDPVFFQWLNELQQRVFNTQGINPMPQTTFR